jgi:hypothetical protein
MRRGGRGQQLAKTNVLLERYSQADDKTDQVVITGVAGSYPAASMSPSAFT